MNSQKPQIHTITHPGNCPLYRPGHQVHWIQARVKSSEPRFDARISKIDEITIKVCWLTTSQTFQYHDVARLLEVVARAVDDNIKFAPTSSLLYVQTQAATEIHGGSFALFYLAKDPLTPCLR